MSGSVFVVDTQGQPLMPMSSAYARKLVRQSKAHFQPHYAFTVLQLERSISHPRLQPIVLALRLHPRTAEMYLFATGERAVFPMMKLMVDLKTDLPRRMRRRAGHRRRRRSRSRYRTQSRFGVPFKLRRPSFMRSAWAHSHRSRRGSVQANTANPVSIQWQIDAIARVVIAVQRLLPLSHVVFLPITPGQRFGNVSHTPAQRRSQLLEAYGAVLPNGSKTARCGYCLTMKGTIEVEHIVPLSSGGKDAWSNLTLACAPCNDRKGNRTPIEAGMMLQVRPTSAPPATIRASSITRTERLIARRLAELGITIIDARAIGNGEQERLSNAAVHLLHALVANEQFDTPLYVVKPIARPRKQQFTARRYAKSTPRRPPYQMVHGAVRRRVRVNKGLAVWSSEDSNTVTVVPLGATIPAHTSVFIKIGMLCEARRNDALTIGIVSAVHSTGRLTLLAPSQASTVNIIWHRITIVPRLHIRVLSTDGIVFLPLQQEGKQTHGKESPTK